uniref:tRNA wybutosine-synthesizing protein 3 homolog n=1 Tax=Otolemur garnettii TaxID=30611 RepID=H0Y1G5_OTOGA
MDRSAEFRRWKAQCLSKADLSHKGSVDEDVVELVQLLNAQEQFFTTSSCTGRIPHPPPRCKWFRGSEKKNCCWLLTHKPCVKDDVIVALKKTNGDALLKFELFVLHVQCRQLQDAQILHSVAIDSGFRNSGVKVGKRGKTMLAVRSTHGFEPLSHKGQLMVTEEDIDFLLNVANQKMEENKKRIGRFYNCLQHALEREALSNSPKIKEKSHPSYTPKKKRNPGKAHGKGVAEENDEELENDGDLSGIDESIFPEDS